MARPKTIPFNPVTAQTGTDATARPTRLKQLNSLDAMELSGQGMALVVAASPRIKVGEEVMIDGAHLAIEARQTLPGGQQALVFRILQDAPE